MRVIGALAMLGLATAASAQVTVTPALVSDYDFRGVSQTAKDPAVQLGVNYAHSSGFYAGVWGSNVDFGPGDPQVEVDFNAGFSFGDATDGIAYDFGALYYTYVSRSDFNFGEIYGGISSGWFSGKLYYSPKFNNVDESAYYVSTTGTFALPMDFTLAVHAGYSGGDYWDRFYGDGYFDWSVGISRTLGKVTLGLAFIDGSDLPDGDNAGCTSGCDVFSTDRKVVGTISTTLPWSAD